MSRNKLLIFLVATAALAAVAAPRPAAAQVPGQIPIQGYLTDAEGVPYDAEVAINFAIYDAATGGTELFSERQNIIVDRGVFSAYLGAVEALDLSMFRDSGELYLGVQVGSDDEASPRLAFGTVPWAAYSDAAATFGGVAASELPTVVDEWAREACLDTEEELTALLDDNYANPSWDSITGVPADIADGDDGFTTEEELTALLDDNYASPAWDALTGVPEGFADGVDNDTLYTAGDGLALSGTELLADASVIREWARDACYDTAGELTAELDGVYAGIGHSHELEDLPEELADGDDDTLAALDCETNQLARMGDDGWECVDAGDSSIGSGLFPVGSVPILYGEARDWLSNRWNYKPFPVYANNMGTTHDQLHNYLDQVRYTRSSGTWVELFGGDNYGNENNNRAWAAAAVFVMNPTDSVIRRRICFTLSSSNSNSNHSSVALNGSNVWSTSGNGLWDNVCVDINFPARTSSVLVLKSGSYRWRDWNGEWNRVSIGFRSGLNLDGTGLVFDYQRYQDYIANR